MQLESSLDNLIFLVLLVVTIIYWASIILPKVKFLTKIGFYGTVLTNGLIFCLTRFPLDKLWLLPFK